MHQMELVIHPKLAALYNWKESHAECKIVDIAFSSLLEQRDEERSIFFCVFICS